MDIQQYISSGVLELYVLQQLPASEMQEVTALRRQYPEIDTEIAAIESSLADLTMLTAKKAPRNVLDNVMQEINDSAVNNNNTNINTLIANNGNVKLFRNWAVAASIALLAMSAYLFTMQNKLASQQTNVAALQTNLQHLKDEKAVYTSAAFTSISLASMDTNNKNKIAQVYWNKTNNEVFIDLKNQTPLGENEQYQLWALADGKPIDAGVLDINTNLQKAKLIANAQAFAITIEKKGGSPTPNLKALVAMGKV
jgi:anti-sigma-K factor RskA